MYESVIRSTQPKSIQIESGCIGLCQQPAKIFMRKYVPGKSGFSSLRKRDFPVHKLSAKHYYRTALGAPFSSRFFLISPYSIAVSCQIKAIRNEEFPFPLKTKATKLMFLYNSAHRG